jgi:hypothetical protein
VADVARFEGETLLRHVIKKFNRHEGAVFGSGDEVNASAKGQGKYKS